MGYPTDSTHLSDLDNVLMIPTFSKMVHSQWAHRVIANRYWNPVSVRGTDTVQDRFIDTTSIQTLQAGVRPPAYDTTTAKRGVTVDRTVITRSNVSLLNGYQVDFNLLRELAIDQGKEHAREYDRVFFQQLARGCFAGAEPGAANAIKGGVTAQLAAGEDKDPDAFCDAIEEVVRQFRIRDIDRSELVCFVWPEEYDVLKKNDKLVSRDFSMAGSDFAKGIVTTIAGIPIVETTAMPRELAADRWADVPGKPQYGGHHPLSHAGNNYMYDPSDVDIRARALIGHRLSLLPGESIGIRSLIWYNKEEHQHFIDTLAAYAVTYRRQDVCGGVFAAAPTP